MADLEAIAAALQKPGRDTSKNVTDLVQKALDEGAGVKDVLDGGLIKGMGEIGAKFKNNEVFVPEVLIAARAMNEAMKILAPKLAEAGVEPVGKIVLGTVKGDLHDIGKNLVGMMFKGAGFEVVDLGIDIAAEKFVEAAEQQGVKLIGLSALLTTTMPQMKTVVEAKKGAGVDAKIIIGGAPVTQAYADEIGADGYAPDAASAVDVGKQLLGL
ncbi:MAG: corrinoid protein [Planctomycetota bacterium]|jgi:5-methyltetrahydrofolate--homocysteine methyltransferase